MSISLDALPISKDLYSKITLPSTSEVIVNGGSGNASIERKLFDNNNNEISVEGDTFIPTKIGNYKLVYNAVDYIGNSATTNLAIEVTDPGHPIFVGEENLPPILIKGHKYTLRNYDGVEVVNGETVSLKSKVYVNNVELTNNTFTASSTCDVKYELNGSTGKETYFKNIPVVDSGNPLNFANYFYGDFVKEVNAEDVKLSASSGDANDKFASLLTYDNLFVQFSTDVTSINFESINFKFTDSTDLNNSLTFKVKFYGEDAYILIGNDLTEYPFSRGGLDKEDPFAIDFNSSTRVLTDIKEKELAVVKFNDQGNPFYGFGGGVYLDITMKGITSDSSLKVSKISNQVLGHLDETAYTDFMKPVVVLKDNFVVEQNYGDNIKIPTADVFDVLSDCNVTLSVVAPDGTYKLREVDARVDQTFVLDQIGTYTITYYGRDSAGNTAKYDRSVSVFDFTAPTLSVDSSSLKESYRLNDSISIPSYQVRDNRNDYTLDIFLLMPDSQQRLLKIDKNGVVTSYLDANSMIYNSSFKVDSNTFKAEQYGNYTLRYVAYDSDFNKTVQELHFSVK